MHKTQVGIDIEESHDKKYTESKGIYFWKILSTVYGPQNGDGPQNGGFY